MMIGLVAYIPDRPRSETTRPCRDSTIPYVYTRLSFNLTQLFLCLISRLLHASSISRLIYAQKIRTHSSFAREMATEPQSKTTRLAEICNRLGSAESLLSSTQLETDKSVDEFLQAEIALSAVQEALRIAQEFFDRAEAKMRTLAFRSGDLNLKREIEELKTEEIRDSFRFDWRKKATGPG